MSTSSAFVAFEGHIFSFICFSAGYTPLYEAVWQKNTCIVKMLLDAGAKVTQSHHLLHYAVLHRHEAMVRLLIGGSIINLRDESGDTPLIVAAKTQQHKIARLLLSNGKPFSSARAVGIDRRRPRKDGSGKEFSISSTFSAEAEKEAKDSGIFLITK